MFNDAVEITTIFRSFSGTCTWKNDAGIYENIFSMIYAYTFSTQAALVQLYKIGSLTKTSQTAIYR